MTLVVGAFLAEIDVQWLADGAGLMETKVRITLEASSWSGWQGEDGYTIQTSAQLWARKGMKLTPMTLGLGGDPDVDSWAYEVLVERIVSDRVGFVYRNVVACNPGGGVNLTLKPGGRFILRRGERVKLATPTMDAGVVVTVTLDEIRS